MGVKGGSLWLPPPSIAPPLLVAGLNRSHYIVSKNPTARPLEEGQADMTEEIKTRSCRAARHPPYAQRLRGGYPLSRAVLL